MGRSIRLLPHMERSSIQLKPNSCDTTWHAWSKSGEISSLITATLNGDFDASARVRREAATVARAAAADPQRNVRREEYDIVILFAWTRKSLRINLSR